MQKSFWAAIALCFISAHAMGLAAEWRADLGNGSFKNPILYADYSDPDVVRVGDDFYLVASSFNCVPGIPVLHSRDLVNWKIIGHVYDRLPFERFNKPQHGVGCWAPSIRYHDKKFWVYFCTPDEGLFMSRTENPVGPWSPLVHVADVAKWEDPCPFWDDDGQAYLVRSQVGAGPLILHKMSLDGTRLLDNGKIIFQDKQKQPTLEGPKLYKINSYYYIFAPAGGVPTGWQSVFRSKNIYGPYEDKIVLHQGTTAINGPHQGGLVELKSGEWWFVHFQDAGAYGRIVHLQPVKWANGWPVIGVDKDGDGIGEPVDQMKKPDVGQNLPLVIPQMSDEFNADRFGLQWQWHANPRPEWMSLNSRKGFLRLNSLMVATQNGNLYYAPNLLLQKFPAPEFSATTSLTFSPELANERAGLVVMGRTWSSIALCKTEKGFELAQFEWNNEDIWTNPRLLASKEYPGKSVFLRVHVRQNANLQYEFSRDGKNYEPFGKELQGRQGVWIGAKVGVFSVNPNLTDNHGFAEFDWFRLE